MEELDGRYLDNPFGEQENNANEVHTDLQPSKEVEVENNGIKKEGYSEQFNGQAPQPQDQGSTTDAQSVRELEQPVHEQPAGIVSQLPAQPVTVTPDTPAQVQQLSPEGYDLVKMKRDLTRKTMTGDEISDTYPIYFRKRGLLKVDIDNLSTFFNLKLNGEYLLTKRQGRKFLTAGRQYQIESFRKGELPARWEVTDDDADDNREPPAKRPRTSTAPSEERGATAQPEQSAIQPQQSEQPASPPPLRPEQPAYPPPQQPEQPAIPPPQQPENGSITARDVLDLLREHQESERRHQTAERKAQIKENGKTERRRLELEFAKYKVDKFRPI